MTQSLRSSLLPLCLVGLAAMAWLMYLSPHEAGDGSTPRYVIDLDVYREGGFLSCGALGFLAAPASSLTYWTRALWDPSRIGNMAYSGNQSLRGMVSRIAPEHASSLWFLGCIITMAALWWIMRWIEEHTGGEVALMLLASSVVLLCSPVSWSHHYTWLSLAAVYLVLRRRWTFAALTWFVLLARGHWLVPYADHRELGWSWWQQIPGNDYVFVTVVLVIASVWFSSGSMGAAWRHPHARGFTDHPSTAPCPKPTAPESR